MPAQPLSSKKPITGWRYGADILSLHPTLSPYIAEVVAIGSMIEQQWALMLCSIANADAAAAIAMHQALSSTSAQRAAFEAVASIRLSDDNKLLLEAVRMATKGYAKIRNNFCHHIWGDSPELPDCLLLFDPIVMAEFRAFANTPTDRYKPEDITRIVTFNRTKILVYEESDLKEARDTMANALLTISTLCNLLLSEELDKSMTLLPAETRPPSMREQARARLVAEPAVAQALQRLALQKSKSPS